METFYRQASVARRCYPRTKSSRVTNSPAPALASRNAGSIPAPAEQAQTARPRPRQAHAQDVDLLLRKKCRTGRAAKKLSRAEDKGVPAECSGPNAEIGNRIL